MKTQVAIVGAGPDGLMLSHLLHINGIESVVFEKRSRHDVEGTIRAGILEQDIINLLVDTGVSDRVLRDGEPHEGIELRFNGQGHRIDFRELVDREVNVYPQHEFLIDLIARRLADGGDVRFETSVESVHDVETDTPSLVYRDADGEDAVLHADIIVGADGNRTVTRASIPLADDEARPGDRRVEHINQYPFAWFGILAEAPKTSEELIYANHPNGFALISTRSETVQRHYLQCDPNDSVEDWSDDRIWSELHARVDGEGAEVKDGAIFDKSILRFRSSVNMPMQHGRLYLVGDAAHTVPPTGAKGLNVAVADAWVLAHAVMRFYRDSESDLLDAYTDLASPRVWRTQHFSWWMTQMLHRIPAHTSFQRHRQLAELDAVTRSRAGRTYLAELYTGTPLPRFDGGSVTGI